MSRARDLSNFVNPAAISVDGSFNVGINSVTPDVKLDVVGVVSATSFTGDGANISNVSASSATTSEGLTGTPDIDVRNVTGTAGTFSGPLNIDDTTESTSTSTGALIVDGGVGIAKSLHVGGNLSVGGTLTYEDVTNVDSIGVITARQGVHFGTQAAGTLVVGDSDGIGIGTDNPSVLLHLMSSAPIIELQDSDSTGVAALQRIDATQSGGVTQWFLGQNSTTTSELWIQNITNSDIRFGTNNTERVRITSDGDVGIGTDDPTAKLTIGAPSGAGGNTSVALFKLNNTTEAWYGVANGAGNIITGSAIGDSVIRNDGGNILFSVDSGTTEAARISAGGSFGIGTDAPTQKLVVKGNGDGIRIEDGNATDGYNIIREDSTGFLHFVGDQTTFSGYRFFTNDTDERLTILNNGNVGIGTDNPQSLLDVDGGVDNPSIRLVRDTGGGDVGSLLFVAKNQSPEAQGRIDYRGGSSNDGLKFTSGGTQRMVIDTSGLVGIGTDNPRDTLDVVGGIQAESLLTVRAPVITSDATNLAGSGINLWTQTTATDGDWFPALTWSGNSGAQNRARAGITAISEAAVNVASSLIFMTRNAADGSSLTPADEKVRITSDGNVNIGGSFTQTAYPFQLTGNGGADAAALAIRNLGNHPAKLHLMSGHGDWSVSNSTSVADAFEVRDESANSTRMTINNSGQVDIGNSGYTGGVWHTISSPNSATSGNNFALRVYNRNTNSSAATRGILIRHDLDPNDTNAALEFTASSTTRCIIRNNGGIGNFQANDSNLSDERMKKNIVGVDTQWDVVKSWEVKKFNFNFESDSDPLHIGAIAQQIETISPEVVTNFDNETDTKSLKEQQMMWMAIKALQEAQARIETLEAEVAALKAG